MTDIPSICHLKQGITFAETEYIVGPHQIEASGTKCTFMFVGAVPSEVAVVSLLVSEDPCRQIGTVRYVLAHALCGLTR